MHRPLHEAITSRSTICGYAACFGHALPTQGVNAQSIERFLQEYRCFVAPRGSFELGEALEYAAQFSASREAHGTHGPLHTKSLQLLNVSPAQWANGVHLGVTSRSVQLLVCTLEHGDGAWSVHRLRANLARSSICGVLLVFRIRVTYTGCKRTFY